MKHRNADTHHHLSTVQDARTALHKGKGKKRATEEDNAIAQMKKRARKVLTPGAPIPDDYNASQVDISSDEESIQSSEPQQSDQDKDWEMSP